MSISSPVDIAWSLSQVSPRVFRQGIDLGFVLPSGTAIGHWVPGDWQSAEVRPCKPQWSRAQDQLSMKEVVRWSSPGGGGGRREEGGGGSAVERSGARPSSVSWHGGGREGRGFAGWGGWKVGRLPGDPQEPADVAWGERIWPRPGQDCSWSAKMLGLQEDAETNKQLSLHVDRFPHFMSILKHCALFLCDYFYLRRRPLEVFADCTLLYGFRGPPPLSTNVIVTA